MVRSYLAAQCVSIVADYPCYFYLKRTDGKNIASARSDPHGYYSNLREVLDVIDATRGAGGVPRPPAAPLLPRRDAGTARGRLLAAGGDADYRAKMFAEIRRLALERFPENVPAGLEAQHRVRATLVREGRLEDLKDFAGRVAQVTCHRQHRSACSGATAYSTPMSPQASCWLTAHPSS